MAETIPEWAAVRACELLNGPQEIAAWAPSERRLGGVVATFARYIAQHEQPPVDPDLIEAREIVKATLVPESHARCDCREKIDAGEWDRGHKVRATLAAIKRGRELERGA